MQKTTLLTLGAAAACYLGWRRLAAGRGAELAPGIVIDQSKARALLDLGAEVARAGVEQVLSSKVGRAA